MRRLKTTYGALMLTGLLSINFAFADGVWDDNVVLIGLNPNGNFQGGDEVRIKKATGGASGCTIVKFRPGFGNLPADSSGIDARNRIYAAALAAFMADKPVSIWVWDTTNCYGLMLEFTDGSPF